MERLTPLSAAVLDAEDAEPGASLAIGSFAVFEGPAPAFEDFVATIDNRLPLLPRYRQRVRTVPLDLAAPAWVDDPHFDLCWHLRNTALPSPGGPAEIGRLLSRVMSGRMDRRRPLWEYWFVEGVAGGRWALLSKLHHSMVDGVSGTEIYQLILDPSPQPRTFPAAGWQPAVSEPAWAFDARALGDLLTWPARAAGRLTALAAASPRTIGRRAARTAQGLMTLSEDLLPFHRTSLSGPLHGGRRYAWAEVPISDIDRVRRAFGCTLNDVALTAVTGAFRRLLLARGEAPERHALRSLVPVSTREPGAEGVPDNRVSLLLPYLPVEVADPRARLAAVRSRVRVRRTAGEAEAGGALTEAAEHSAFPPVSWGIRLAWHLPQRQIATVTTNVPGPRRPLYALGREALTMLPYVPIADRVRVGIAIFSYRGTLTFGITADYDTVPDIAVLADGITASMAELVAQACRLG